MDWQAFRTRWTAAVCVFLMVSTPALPAESVQQESQGTAPQTEPAKIPNDQLDSLVAPIALYPDPLLAQVLAASTYPLELIQLQQWLEKNKGLKDKELTEAVKKQPWDPSVQAMAVLPDAVKRLAGDIQWTTDLGNAFLAQQSDVMDAVQRMRKKAQEKGNLKTGEQQKVETKVVESKQVIVIEQANPQVVYVPSYNPTVVYGPPVYPYPPVTYPPPGYYAAGVAISFGVGMMMGAAFSGGWGWGCGWGGNNNVTINNNNNFNRNTNVNGGNRANVNGGNRANQLNASNRSGNSWQHNPQHRGGAPYGDRNTANKFGGSARGDSMGNRQNNARQGQRGDAGNRAAGGAGDRAGSRGGAGDNRPGASTNDRGGNRGGGGDRPSAGTSDRGGNRGGGGGGDRVGDRSVSSGANGRSGGAFGGSSASGNTARKSSSRGASSMGSGGGGSRGGGGRRR